MTIKEIKKLNEFQNNPAYHPFTCITDINTSKCEKRNETGEGKLIATLTCWICPCGAYKQNYGKLENLLI